MVLAGGSIGGGVFVGGCLVQEGQLSGGSFPEAGLVIDGPEVAMDVWDMITLGGLEIRRGSLWLNNQGVLDIQGCQIRNQGKLAIQSLWGQVMSDASSCVIHASAWAATVLIGVDIPVQGSTVMTRSRLPWLGW
ncbi:MAG: hypothetical protein HC898_11890 [Phycisphaerales bacterium]|nr:hypothetical protein [Phycisphaerales bacterium]